MVLRACLLLALLACSTLVVAQEGPVDLSAPLASQAPANLFGGDIVQVDDCCSTDCCCGDCWFSPGWFIGLGGSFNSVRIDQTLSGVGVSDIYSNGILVATGTASGPAAPLRETETTFAPALQAGFISAANDCGWLWGSKFTYKYLGVTFSDNNVDAPQLGTFVETADPSNPTTFTGNAFTDSIQTTVNHELAFVPLVGRSFGRGHLYLGGGPVVYQVDSRIYGASSYADINGTHTNIGGLPLDLSSSEWLWGGLWQLGYVYYLRPTCFIDVSYDFAVTGENTQNYPVSTTSVQNGDTYDTQIVYSNVQRLWAQSLTVTFNLTF